MSRTLTLALAVLAVLALAACTKQEPEISLNEQVPAEAREEEAPADGEAGDGAEADVPAEADATTEWVAVDVEFADFDTEVSAGNVAIVLDNQGNLPHDVTIEELGDRTVVAAQGGETATDTVELEPGTYTFYCSVPGHRGTMEETVEVS